MSIVQGEGARLPGQGSTDSQDPCKLSAPTGLMPHTQV